MPKNEVSDLITDQEIAFAHLVLSGTMTDRQAAEAAGLNPDTAAYTKAKPRVRAYMVENRAAVSQKLVEQETDLSRPAVEGLTRLHMARERALTRLWEIADMSPERTRNSLTAQVKALSMIISIEGLIPDRRAGSSGNQSDPPPTPAKMYTAAWLREQQGETNVPEPGSDPVPDKNPAPDPSPSAAAPSDPSPYRNESIPVAPVIPSEPAPSSPYARVPDAAPDLRLPLSMQINPFGHRR